MRSRGEHPQVPPADWSSPRRYRRGPGSARLLNDAPRHPPTRIVTFNFEAAELALPAEEKVDQRASRENAFDGFYGQAGMGRKVVGPESMLVSTTNQGFKVTSGSRDCGQLLVQCRS
jgi:hypothetical protein